MKTIACALWLGSSALAGLLLVIGYLAMLPGRAVAFMAKWLLKRLGE